MRSLADGEFCCDGHREAFHQQQSTTPEPSKAPPEAPQEAEAIDEPEAPVIAVTPLTPIAPEAPPRPAPEPEVSAAIQRLRLRFAPPPATIPEPSSIPEPIAEIDKPAIAPAAELAFSNTPELPAVSEPALAQTLDVEPEPVAYEPSAEQLYEDAPAEQPYEEALEVEDPAEQPEPRLSWRGATISWQWIRTAWNTAPRDLKLVTVALPILAAIAVTGSFPKVPIKTVAPAQVAQVEKAVNEQWKNLNQTISNRAAIAYADDFRSGLDAWQGRSNLTASWSYDAAGFVRPGPLALFKPTLDLADYRFEFLGEIDQKAIGWVFRAEDLKNYYAMKLVVVKPGPLPLVDMVRYAVINGKEGPQVRKPLPLTVRADMLYRLMVDVRGADFTVMAQGQVVDFWTDHRLQHGGVGFFSGRGERARLRWVEVSHQYDALGRVCAYLAPYGLEGRNGSFN
ncbi:MAG TPA: hypothetical protein VKG79_01425 [Bryobacteraceae bacterium]|nr:hypothetical protein [Bryobacteraceae bacterium]